MLGASLAAATLIVRRRMADLAGASRVVACGLLACVLVVAVHVVPLALGVLSRPTVLATALLVIVAAGRIPRRAPANTDAPEVPGSPTLARLAAGAAACGLLAYVLAFLADHGSTPIGDLDALVFHLPQSGRWIQSGSLWQIDTLSPGWAFGNYPNHGDVLQLAVMLPFRNDAFVRFVSLPMAGLTVAAIYAAGVELRAHRAAALAAAVVVVALPTFAVIVVDHGMTDPAGLMGFSAGVLFGLRHARTGARSDLVLAALGLGFMLGTKWYGLSSGALLVGVWAVARLIARHPWRTVAADTTLGGAAMLAVGGIWLLRNLVLSGNPFFPLAIGPFRAPPDPIREQLGFSLLHYLTDPGVWRDTIAGQLLRSFGLAGAMLAAAAVAGIVIAWRRDRRVAVLGASAVALLVLYAATPYSALGPEGDPSLAAAAARYALPAMAAAAPVLAWLATRVRWAGTAFGVFAVLLVADAIRRYPAFAGGGNFAGREARTLAAVVVVSLVVAVAVLVARRAPWNRIPGGRRPTATAALVTLAAGLLVGAGQLHQRALNDERYGPIDTAFAWINENAGADRRIGVAGIAANTGYPAVWPVFGARIDNEVEYIGPFVRERLERHTTEGGYRTAVREGRFDLVIVGMSPGRDGTVPELEWTRAEGYSKVLRSKRVTILQRP